MKCTDFFNRCTYDVYENGATVPEQRVYIVRNYGGGESVIDATQEMIMCCCPDGLDVRRTHKAENGEMYFLAHTIEYVNRDCCVCKFCNFVADPEDYTLEQLVEHPELLPNGLVEDFKAFYAKIDERKKEVF